jgi:hypothetical protein
VDSVLVEMFSYKMRITGVTKLPSLEEVHIKSMRALAKQERLQQQQAQLNQQQDKLVIV